MIPKYINKKIDKLNSLLDEARAIKNEIENWAESKGADTSSYEWYAKAIDDCNDVKSIYKDGLAEYFESRG